MFWVNLREERRFSLHHTETCVIDHISVCYDSSPFDMVSKIVGTKFRLSPCLHVKCHKLTIWVPILVTECPYFIQIWVPIGSLFKKCLTFHQKAQKVRHKGWNSIKSEWKITNYPLTRTKSYVLTNSQTDDDDGNLVEPQFDDRLKAGVAVNKQGQYFVLGAQCLSQERFETQWSSRERE